MNIFFSVIFLSVLHVILALDNSCGKEQLPCDSGHQCIDRNLWCDKKQDCDDGSDEAYCETRGWFELDPNKCRQSHFLCKTGVCVPKIAKCDGYNNCNDYSDEQNCKTDNSSSSSEEEEYDKITAKPESHTTSERIRTTETNHFIESEETTWAEAPSEELQVKRHSSTTIASYYDIRMKEADKDTKSKVSEENLQQRKSSFTTKISRTFLTTPVPSLPRNLSRFTTRYPSRVNDRSPTFNRRESVSYNRSPAKDGYSSIYNYRPPTFASRPAAHTNNFQSYSIPNPRSSYDNRAAMDRVNGDTDWRSASSLRPYKREIEVRKPFVFAKTYADLYSEQNGPVLRKGENWIMSQRRAIGDWGRDTARVLIAFALVNNNFPSGIDEFEVMKRRFMTQLGVDLLRNSTKEFNVNRIAIAMNALLAVCENPRDFHGIDLTELLQNKIREHVRKREFLNPSIYLSLCLSGKDLSYPEVQNLMKQMLPSSSSLHEKAKDMQSLAIQAFSCHMQQSDSKDHDYRKFLQTYVHNATSNLLHRIDEEGNFGSIYSTALAAQALISVNSSNYWNSEKTLKFLKQQQIEDGSFGDMLSTYYILPVLSGRSLLHLRNIDCTPPDVTRDMTPPEILEFIGPKQYVHYSIYFGNPLVNSHSLRLLVPHGINFMDVMRVAEYQNNDFRFMYEEENKYVYSISGVPNDAEQGFYWYLYIKLESDSQQHDINERERYTGDLNKLHPRSDQHMIFWYHPEIRP